MSRRRLIRGREPRGCEGLTLVELSVSVVVATVLMLATATAFSKNLQAVGYSERMSDGALFLESTFEDVSAVAYDDLLALDGNQLLDGPTLARSNFTVDLTVFEAEVGLCQITAVLSDLRSGREMARTNVLRASR